MVLIVYGKAKLLEQISYTNSNPVITLWAGPVMCRYQDLMTSGWITPTTITSVIMYWFKELTAPKQVLIRSYLFILRENSLYTNGNGPCHTNVSWTLSTAIKYLLSFPSQYSIHMKPG